MELELNNAGSCYKEQFLIGKKKHMVKRYFTPVFEETGLNETIKSDDEEMDIEISVNSRSTEDILRRNQKLKCTNSDGDSLI